MNLPIPISMKQRFSEEIFMLRRRIIISISGIIVLTALLVLQYSCAVPRESDSRVAEYTAVIEKDPNNTEAYHGRGKVYLEKKEYEKAAADFQKAISKAPERLEVLCDRGGAYIEM